MNPDKPTLLLVDDEPFNLEILKGLLEEKYNLHMVENGQACLDIIHSVQPHLILLDVNMPEMDGLTLCKTLKADEEVTNIPVMFISALTSADERLAGYSAGAEDYIGKPFNQAELLTKIQLLLEAKQSQKELKLRADEAMNMAMTAMTSAGEMGQVLQFTRDSYQCKSYEELAKLLISTYRNYGLDITIRVVNENNIQYFSTSEKEVSNIEKSVFESKHNINRFVDYHDKTLMNYEHVTTLVKNMPLDNAELYGRIKDVMGYLGEITEARAISLNMELALQKREDTLKSVINTTKETLNEIEMENRINAEQNRQILSEMIGKIEGSYHILGLSDEQEEQISHIMSSAEQASQDLHDTGFKIEERFQHIVDSLTIQHSSPEKPIQLTKNKPNTDIELF
ncbi:MAG: response regulator [Gammaproteobacteria bacterium]|nr:response regulator [Gammaproteobacteria bacterium]